MKPQTLRDELGRQAELRGVLDDDRGARGRAADPGVVGVELLHLGELADRLGRLQADVLVGADLEAEGLRGLLAGRDRVLAVGVVRVDEDDLRRAGLVGPGVLDELHRGADRVAVAGADEEVVGGLGRVGDPGVVGGRHVDDLVGVHHLLERVGVAGAPALDQEDPLVLVGLVEVYRVRDLVGVVVCGDLDRPAVHAAVGVDVRDRVLHGDRVVRADVGGRSRDVEDAADLDRVGRRRRASAETENRRGNRRRADKCTIEPPSRHCPTSVWWLFFPAPGGRQNPPPPAQVGESIP